MAEINILKGVFDLEAVDTETAKFNKMIEELLASMPPIHKRTPQEVREERESGKSWLGPIKRLDDEAQERVVKGRSGDVPIRVFVPDEVNGVYLHIHGGGFVLMRPYYFDETLAEIAKRCKVVVVSVDYRLAPENPYSAAPDDCETVAVWLAEKAKSEFGSEKLIIGGESAGGNLSVVTLDPLLDDSLFMTARWSAAGNRCELALYPGGMHVFNFFPIKIAQEANDRIFDFISKSAEG